MIAKCGLVAGVAIAFIWGAVDAARASAEVEPQSATTEMGTVSGAGTVVLNRKPELMRMRVDVVAQGKSMKEALANLNDRRQAIKTQLAKLGSVKESVIFGSPHIDTTVLQARQQMAMMIMARMGNRSKKSAKKTATPAVISARLTAEWPLKGENPDELLVEVSQLQEAINAADLAGKKELEKLSGEDEEMSQELAGMQANMGGDPSQAQPGTPTFTLVSKITPQDHSRALADAFQKAKTHAQETARAAGAELGALRQIGSTAQAGGDSGDGENPDQAYSRSARAYLRMMGMGDAGGQPGEAANPLEATGTQPGDVAFHVTVNASFELKARP
jgi:uncharacterized protein YggE